VKEYECVVVLAPNVGSEVLESATKKCKDVITSRGGTVTALDDWGKRGLAYEINFHREGYYHFYRFQGSKEIVDELNRQLRIDENVIRHLIVREERKAARVATEQNEVARTPQKEDG
jgi:small subunit ribosomal protein S6